MQLFRPGAGRARLFFRLHRRRASMAIFFAPFIAPAPCRDLVAKTLHDTSYHVLRPCTRILMLLNIGPLIPAAH